MSNIVVRVGKKSNIEFSSHIKVVRAITFEELKIYAENPECHLVIIENIRPDEYNDTKDFIVDFQSKNPRNKVMFFVPDNDETTTGLGDELAYDIYVSLSDLYSAIDTQCKLAVSVRIADKQAMNSIGDADASQIIEDSDVAVQGAIDDDISVAINTIDSLPVETQAEAKQKRQEEVDAIMSGLGKSTITLEKGDESKFDDIFGDPSEHVTVETGSSKKKSGKSSSASSDDMEKLENELRAKKAELADLRVDYSNAIKDNRDATQRIIQLEQLLTIANDEKDTVQQAFDEIVKVSEVLEDPISLSEYQGIQADLETSTARVAELTGEVADLQSKLTESNSTLAQQSKQIDELNTQIESLESKLEAVNDSISSGAVHKDVVTFYDNQISKLNKDKESLASDFEAVNTQNQIYSEQIAELTTKVTAESKYRLEAIQFIQAVTNSLKVKLAALSESTVQVATITAELQSANARITELTGLLEAANKKAEAEAKRADSAEQQMQEQLSAKDSEIDGILVSRDAAAKEQLKAKEAEMAEAIKNKDEELAKVIESKDAELASAIAGKDAEIASRDETITEQSEQIEELGANITSLNNQLEEARKKIQSCLTKIAEHEKTIASRDKTIEEKDKTISEKDQTISESNDSIKEYSDSVQQALENIAGLNAQIGEQTTQITNLNQRIQELERQLSDTQTQLDEALGEKDSIEADKDSTIANMLIQQKKQVEDLSKKHREEVSRLQTSSSKALEEASKMHSDQMTRTVNGYKTQLQEMKDKYEEEISSLNQEHTAALTKAFTDAKKAVDDSVAVKDAEISKLRASMEQAAEQAREHEEQALQAQAGTVESLKTQVDEKQKKISELEGKITELNDEIKSLNEIIISKEKDIARLTKKLEKSEETLKNTLSAFQASIGTEASNSLGSGVSTAEVTQLMSEVESLKKQLAEANAKIAEANKRKDSIDGMTIEQWKEKAESLENENTILSEKVEGLNAAHKELEAENTELTGKLEIATTESEHYRELANSSTVVNVNTIGSGGITVPPIRYNGTARIVSVFGTGSFGITTTAMSIAHKLAATSRVLYVDLDLVSPKADAWFKKPPFLTNTGINGVTGKGMHDSSLGILFEKGTKVFIQYLDSMIIQVERTKGGGIDFLSGVYQRVTSEAKVAAVDFEAVFNELSKKYNFIVLDLGRFGNSEFNDSLIKAMHDISQGTIVVSSHDYFEIRNFLIKLEYNNIAFSNLSWLVNMCPDISKIEPKIIDRFKKSQVRYGVIQEDSTIRGIRETFLKNRFNSQNFNLFLSTAVFGNRA